MAGELQPHELEAYAERIRRGFAQSTRTSADHGRPAVVTGIDGLAHYRVDELWEEITYLGYHLNWGLDTLLDLGHRDRRMLVSKVAALNERAWEEAKARA